VKLVVLGATGSIGRQTLEVAEHLGCEVVGLAAFSGGRPFAELSRAHPDASLALVEEPSAELRDVIGRPVELGAEAVEQMAATQDTIVVNGVVGVAGLRASVAALGAGNRLALANKETLVAAGDLVQAVAAESGAEIIPVDSEHSAIHQCLVGEHITEVRRIVLTASGGPFFGRAREELADVTPTQALRHPTWDMGLRITTDSATLVNKGLEVIEAHVLFGIDYEQIDVVVHRQSIVHSLVEFVDGSLKSHVGHPDMRIPIQYALTFPHRAPSLAEPFTLTDADLTFEEPDTDAFPALELAYAAGQAGGAAPCAFNAADEVAVEAFHGGQIAFLDIPTILEAAVDAASTAPLTSIEAVVAADEAARAVARQAARSL